MITGAIAKVPSVGISGKLYLVPTRELSTDFDKSLQGPNSMLSRDSFSEPVSVYDLNTLTFNVVPKHDIIPSTCSWAIILFRRCQTKGCFSMHSG